MRNLYLVHTIPLPVLAVQALPAEVRWTAAPPPGLGDIHDRTCLLYLGQAADTSVFYDVRADESLRIPSGQIQVSLRHTVSVWDRCALWG